ncbi:LysM domain-containing protein [Arthrobacter sp. 49Tsu3.1M3]|uniref:LysM peptidoglycan-binding domain-containing protein n=1 Tax=Arthrobacter sp. 49Tsu3.1M3 TaxID=1279029 RepID=UPI0009A5C8FE|nr:LysM domain-containing protein [Arthrobacter sp. 49Tsu3.1M3]SKB76376.1 LysM domain-containing protein [Arthrobacter sp. 49Tsu3.1M3]
MHRRATPHPGARPLPVPPPGQTVRADAAMAAAILLLGIFLAATGSFLIQRWQSGSARRQSLSFEDQLGIVANTTGLIVITWWVMSLAFAVAAALLDRLGRTRAAAATGRFSPAFMRRLVLAAVGLQLLTAPLASAATGGPGPDRPGPAAVSASWTPSPVQALAPDPQRPGAGPALDPRWKPLSPVVDAGPLAARHVRAQDIPGARREVTVRSGDSLWSIAAAALGPLASDADIAREWPRLYAGNRDAIGADPHFLRPGQVLVLPPPN